MKRITLPLILTMLVAILVSWNVQKTSREIINTMLTDIKKVKTLKFTMKSWERLEDGRKQYNEVDAKVGENPFRLYLLSKAEPNEGVEVIYNPPVYGDKAKINPGGWLPNVSLDPYGSKMRKDQHHTIMSTGFNMLHSIISRAISRQEKEAPGQFETYFKYDGDVTWNGRNCYKITITDPNFKFVDYTVKAGESVQSLQNRDAICGYLILDRNADVDDFDDLKEGMVIKKPTSYAKTTVLYIDKQHNMPIVQIMSDDKGEFERYEFHNLQFNPAIKDIEFTKDFDGYGF